MSSSHLPIWLSSVFASFAQWLDPRNRARLPVLLLGILFASGRRTVTSWFRAAGITTDFRPAYHLVHVVGRRAAALANSAWLTAFPCLQGSRRLLVAIDDTPTRRYGPQVQGAGLHHDPTPGPTDATFLYGHIWVCLAAIAHHATRGAIALPLLAKLYVREKDVPRLPAHYRWTFRTKLELAAELLQWLAGWVRGQFDRLVVVIDGGYAKRPFLQAARQAGFEVIGRLRKDAALFSVPSRQRRPGQRGPLPTYGKERLSLAKRAGQSRGWQQIECVQYGQRLTKTIKTFLATWHPAGGVIRVVLIQEEDFWLPLFSTNPDAPVEEILEAAADRNSHEQGFKDVKEIWGAGQQQVRDLFANVGAFHLCSWQYTLVEVWAWERSDEEVVDRSRSPWDDPTRRASHADKRKALQRQVFREEISRVVAEGVEVGGIEELAERLLALAA